MEENKNEYKTIDEYIAIFTPEVQDKLQELRRAISETAPEAVEKISWRMPTYDLHGNLVHFAAFKKHIGFYPGDSGIAKFQDKLTDYKSSKGAVQFSIDKPLPLDLVREIVLFRVDQNINWQKEKLMKATNKKSNSNM